MEENTTLSSYVHLDAVQNGRDSSSNTRTNGARNDWKNIGLDKRSHLEGSAIDVGRSRSCPSMIQGSSFCPANSRFSLIITTIF